MNSCPVVHKRTVLDIRVSWPSPAFTICKVLSFSFGKLKFWAGRTEKDVTRWPWLQSSTKEPWGIIRPITVTDFNCLGKLRLHP
jgi:hypothetical protein